MTDREKIQEVCKSLDKLQDKMIVMSKLIGTAGDAADSVEFSCCDFSGLANLFGDFYLEIARQQTVLEELTD